VRPDLVSVDDTVNPRDYIGKFWVDSLVHDKKAMLFLLDIVGEDKICVGSDYPFPLGEELPGNLVDQLKLSGAVNVKLFYKNAIAWLGIDPG
jgi:aminocarboxymuconate-semialdehyde decarboxylase